MLCLCVYDLALIFSLTPAHASSSSGVLLFMLNSLSLFFLIWQMKPYGTKLKYHIKPTNHHHHHNYQHQQQPSTRIRRSRRRKRMMEEIFSFCHCLGTLYQFRVVFWKTIHRNGEPPLQYLIFQFNSAECGKIVPFRWNGKMLTY